jgi:hypothetical protein
MNTPVSSHSLNASFFSVGLCRDGKAERPSIAQKSRELPSKPDVELHVGSTDGKTTTSTASRTAMQKVKSIAARVLGFVGAFAMGCLGLLMSPLTSIKYLYVALHQARRGEGEKAVQALGLAITAPMWKPLDNAAKTYASCLKWSDGGKFQASEWESIKAHAKEGVFKPKVPGTKTSPN